MEEDKSSHRRQLSSKSHENYPVPVLFSQSLRPIGVCEIQISIRSKDKHTEATSTQPCGREVPSLIPGGGRG